MQLPGGDHFWVVVVLSVWALAIAIVDVRRLRISNALLLLALVPAMLVQAFMPFGLLGASTVQAVAGGIVSFCLLFVGYSMGKVGAGDVKYAAVIGFLTGLVTAMQVMAIAAIALGLVSLAVLIDNRLRQRTVRKIPAGACLSLAFVLGSLGIRVLP